LLGNRGFENIIAEIRDRWTLALQNVVAEIGYRRTGRNRAFQYILAHIRLFAVRTCRTNGTRMGFMASTGRGFATTVTFHSIVTKSFKWHSFTEIKANGQTYNKDSNGMKYGQGHSVRNLLFKR
jgi:hypothetical protein